MPIRFNNIRTTRNREYDSGDIQKIYDNLWYLTPEQKASVVGSVIEESGGNPLAASNTGKYRGLLQWGSDRYMPISGNMDIERYNQLQELRSTIDNTTDRKSWTHGGKGSGYRTGEEAYRDFSNPDAPLEKVMRGFSYGYVRPKGKEDSYNNRLNVTRQVYDRIKGDNLVKSKDNRLVVDWEKTRPQQFFRNQYAEGGSMEKPKGWDELSMKEKSDVIRAGVWNGLNDIESIKGKWNEFAEGGWLMEDGGYSPGNGIRNDIAKWEGSSMKTNRSFEAEAEDFNRVIPKNVRDRLTPDQLNALYSYGYNVGMGNLKKRVLPTLEEYVNGRASADDVGRSMWATKDMLYRGLQRRREWERNMFAGRPYSSRSNGIAYNPNISNNAAVEVATMTPFQFTGPRPQVWQQEEAVEDKPQWFDVVLENARKNPVAIEEPEVMATPEPQEERYTPSRADILMALTGMNSDDNQDEWNNIFRQYEDEEPSQGLSIFGNGQRLFAGGGSTDDPENYESQVNAYMSNNTTGLPFVDDNGVPMKEVMLTGPRVVYDRNLGRNLTDEEYLARHSKASTTFDRLDLPQYRPVTPAEGWAMRKSADRDWLENVTNGVPRERGLEIVSPEFDMVMLPRAVANGAIGATWNGGKELLKNATEGFKSYVARHPKLQYGLAGLDAAMGAEGIDRARNGELDAQTALDLTALAAPVYGINNRINRFMNSGSWAGNLLHDFSNPTQIGKTLHSMYNGRYIYDKPTLLKNARRIKNQAQEGVDNTSRLYQYLTGDIALDLKNDYGGVFKKPEVVLVPKKSLGENTMAQYRHKDKSIQIPIRKSVNTNRTYKPDVALEAGGHEATHAIQDRIRLTTPPIKVYSEQTGYHIPNKDNYVASKYYDDFMKYGNQHGKSPEETLANYFGYLARPEAVNAKEPFGSFNWSKESIPSKISTNFVQDYLRYLNTGNNTLPVQGIPLKYRTTYRESRIDPNARWKNIESPY